MNIETVETTSQPMLFVTRSAGMDPKEIANVMGEAFGAIGGFIGRAGIVPAGPPLSVYRDMQAGKMTIDVGFPVAEAETAKASGEVAAGKTPAGKAFKAIHRGPYATLRQTYGAITEHMKQAGLPMATVAWEVYVSDPDKTPEKDLVTEVYMR